MKLSQALRLSPLPRIALVGAGGKSTAMFTLARELVKPVLLTTTTHLGLAQLTLADHHFMFTTPDQVPWPGEAGVRHFLAQAALSAFASAKAREEVDRALELRRRHLGDEHPTRWPRAVCTLRS